MSVQYETTMKFPPSAWERTRAQVTHLHVRFQSQAFIPHVQDIPQAPIWQSSEVHGAELVWQTAPLGKPRTLALVARRHGHLQRDLCADRHYRTYGASVRNTMIQRKLWASQDKL